MTTLQQRDLRTLSVPWPRTFRKKSALVSGAKRFVTSVWIKKSPNSRNNSAATQNVILGHRAKVRNVGQDVGDSDED